MAYKYDVAVTSQLTLCSSSIRLEGGDLSWGVRYPLIMPRPTVRVRRGEFMGVVEASGRVGACQERRDDVCWDKSAGYVRVCASEVCGARRSAHICTFPLRMVLSMIR